MFHNNDYNNQNGVVVDSLSCKYINNINFNDLYNNTISGLFSGGGSGNNNITCNNLYTNIDIHCSGMIHTYAISINNNAIVLNNLDGIIYCFNQYKQY